MNLSKSLYHTLLVSTLLVMLEGCTPANKPPEPTPQTAHEGTVVATTPLHTYLHCTDKPLGKRGSAFYPLADPYDALAARLFLIDHAQKYIDVQYYIYENDHIGKLFSAHLLQAAQRGVKVHLLLDDISTTGKDEALATLAHHPNITLKLFNPNKLRRTFRNLALLLDVNRLGKRMHNKALIVDDQAAIIGGRNIGDVYFASNKEVLFLDYDILATGHVVKEIASAFKLYWESPQSHDAKDIFGDLQVEEKYRQVRMELAHYLERFKKSKTAKAIARSNFSKALSRHTLCLSVAKETHLFYDHPNKVITDENDNRFHISKQIDSNLKDVHHSLLIVSPYFIPSERMMKELALLRKKGVEITIITNSLASTDVFPVYSGYQSYIRSLVTMGVHLYELKPNSLQRVKRAKKLLQKSIKASLHTKMVIIDNDRLIIGSANIDPRSDKLNTELVLIIRSTTLASAQKRALVSLIKPQILYKVTWKRFKDEEDGHIYSGPAWESVEGNSSVTYEYPPKAPLWKRIGADILSLFPIKGYL